MSYQRKHADLFLLFTDQTQPLVEPYSNRFTLWKEGAELNDFVHPLSFVVYWHFLGKLSLNGVSIFIHTSLLFSYFFPYFWGFLFQNRVWGMKFCYLTCEIPFGLIFRKQNDPRLASSWRSGTVWALEEFSAGVQSSSYHLWALNLSFFIPASLSANCVWKSLVSSISSELIQMYSF